MPRYASGTTRERFVIALKQLVFYAVIVAPLIVLDLGLVYDWSHLAAYLVEAFILIVALLAEGPLQRRFWP